MKLARSIWFATQVLAMTALYCVLALWYERKELNLFNEWCE